MRYGTYQNWSGRVGSGRVGSDPQIVLTHLQTLSPSVVAVVAVDAEKGDSPT